MGLMRKAMRKATPKPVRKAKRVVRHPARTAVRAATPKTIRDLERTAFNVAHPVNAAENAMINSLTGGSQRSPRGGRRGGSSRAYSDEISSEGGFLSEEPTGTFIDRALRAAQQGDTLALKSQDGPIIAVTIGAVLDPVQPRHDYDAAEPGHHLVAVEFKLENRGPGVFAYSPAWESKLIGAHGREYEARQASVAVPTFDGTVRLAAGASRTGYVCYPIDDGDEVRTIEVVFGLEAAAEIGQWSIASITQQARGASNAADDQEEAGFSEVALWVKHLRDSDIHKRQIGAAALAHKPSEAAREALVKALNDPDLTVRTQSLDALVKLGGDRTVGVLRDALQDPVAALRRRAVRFLADIPTDDAHDALRSALTDLDAGVRREAESGLGARTDLPHTFGQHAQAGQDAQRQRGISSTVGANNRPTRKGAADEGVRVEGASPVSDEAQPRQTVAPGPVTTTANESSGKAHVDSPPPGPSEEAIAGSAAPGAGAPGAGVATAGTPFAYEQVESGPAQDAVAHLVTSRGESSRGSPDAPPPLVAEQSGGSAGPTSVLKTAFYGIVTLWAFAVLLHLVGVF